MIHWEGHEKSTSYLRIYNLNTSHLCAFFISRLKQEPQWLQQEESHLTLISQASYLNRDYEQALTLALAVRLIVLKSKSFR